MDFEQTREKSIKDIVEQFELTSHKILKLTDLTSELQNEFKGKRMYFDIILNEHLTELKQYRFHKKKRLKKKFQKKYVKPVPSNAVYVWGKYLFCHPVTRKKITEEMVLSGEVEIRKWDRQI